MLRFMLFMAKVSGSHNFKQPFKVLLLIRAYVNMVAFKLLWSLSARRGDTFHAKCVGCFKRIHNVQVMRPGFGPIFPGVRTGVCADEV
jgi:hypothetical protein